MTVCAQVQGDALLWRSTSAARVRAAMLMRFCYLDGSSYASGNHNKLPATRTVSSYEVLDQVITWFDATYPNLHQIVVAGHSLGGQATQCALTCLLALAPVNARARRRYAAVGKPLSTKGAPSFTTRVRKHTHGPARASEDRILDRGPVIVCVAQSLASSGRAALAEIGRAHV